MLDWLKAKLCRRQWVISEPIYVDQVGWYRISADLHVGDLNAETRALHDLKPGKYTLLVRREP